MPVFEYRCQSCAKRFSTLVGVVAGPNDVVCPSCGSLTAEKLVSRFMRGRTEDDRIDDMADRLEQYGEPDSPAEMRSMVREMGKAVDEDMADDMEAMFEADMKELALTTRTDEEAPPRPNRGDLRLHVCRQV